MRLIRENKCRRKIGVWHLKSSLLHFFPFYICLFSHTRSFLFYFFHSCFVLLLYLVSNFTVLHLLFFSLCRCISSCKDLLRLKFFVVHGHFVKEISNFSLCVFNWTKFAYFWDLFNNMQILKLCYLFSLIDIVSCFCSTERSNCKIASKLLN